MTHGSMRVLPIEAMRDAPMWLCGFAMKICLANCAMIIRFILMRVQRIVGQFFGMSRIAKSLKGRLAYLIRLILFVASRYAQNRRTACTDDPFATRCAHEGYNYLRVNFCGGGGGGKVGTHPSCPAPEPTTPQVTAKVWADSFDDAPWHMRATSE